MGEGSQPGRSTGAREPPAPETPERKTPAGETPAGETPAGETPALEPRTRAAASDRAIRPGGRSDLVETLRRVLERHDAVAVAYLFGSQARASASALSDVDVAVVVDPARAGDRLTLQLELTGAIVDALGCDAVDVVLLDEAPPALAYRVLRDGQLILSRDEALRIRHRIRAVAEYLDTKPLRRRAREALRHRLVEGSFGRS
ncbi:MAG TPA: nucleotidyltransferase domain-containing protein [Candidatus Binatia bacterium]|nr:nucleotidyltransferase domain-containing protein [Candidatus Binatia bacterium]